MCVHPRHVMQGWLRTSKLKRIANLAELARKKLASIRDSGQPAGQGGWPAPRPAGGSMRLGPGPADADVDDERDLERVGVLHPLAGDRHDLLDLGLGCLEDQLVVNL